MLSYEYFRTKAFEEVRISEYEYEMTTARPDLLDKLEQGLQDVITALAVPEEMAPPALPLREVMERNSIAAKITFKRALYLVRLDRFCDAAMTTAFAAYYIQESNPSLREDPFVVIQPALTMALGLLEETLTSYMNPDNYTASDCKSSCGYCQDPLATVAKYCTDVLEDLSAPEYCIKDVWTTAASMLGAYAKVHGGTLDPLRFPDDFPQQAKVSLKLILAHEKSDSKSFLSPGGLLRGIPAPLPHGISPRPVRRRPPSLGPGRRIPLTCFSVSFCLFFAAERKIIDASGAAITPVVFRPSSAPLCRVLDRCFSQKKPRPNPSLHILQGIC